MGAHVGNPPCYQRPSGGLYLVNNDQPDLVSGVWTQVLLNGVMADFNDGIESIAWHHITIPTPGLYFVSGQVGFVNVVNDKNYSAVIRKNNSALVYNQKYTKSGLDPLFIPLSCEAYLEPGVEEEISIWAKSDAGVDTVDVKFGFSQTFLTVQRVR